VFPIPIALTFNQFGTRHRALCLYKSAMLLNIYVYFSKYDAIIEYIFIYKEQLIIENKRILDLQSVVVCSTDMSNPMMSTISPSTTNYCYCVKLT